MKFNHLNVPSHWQNYWTRYPEGHTILEALISWVSQVDSMTDNINEWNLYLDNFVEQFDSELQETATKILNEWHESGFLGDIINTALKTQIDTLETETQTKLALFDIELKANTSRVDALNRGLGQTYATLAELKLAFPNGDTYDHIVTDDGHRYWWNGNAWLDGGIYQAREIADKTVTPNKTDFLERKILNLYNKNLSKDGFFISSLNGVETENASYTATTFMPVTPGKTYIATNNKDGAYYDASFDYIKGTTVPEFSHVAPLNAKWYRASVPLAEKDTYMFAEGTLPDSYVGYGVSQFTVLDNGFKKAISDIAKLAIPQTASNPVERFIGKTLLISGDSLIEKNARSEKNVQDYLKDYLGFANVINDGYSGTGFIREYAGKKGMVDRIASWQPDVDYILLFGPMNDGTSGEQGVTGSFPLGTFTDTDAHATVAGALHSIIKQLINKYPNVPIGVITSPPRNQIGVNGKGWGKDGWFSEWSDMIIKICNHYSIPVVDLYHSSGLRPWIPANNAKYFSTPTQPEGDGIHLNALGHQKISYPVLEFMKKNL